jgi:hypothetical protein
VVIEERNEEAVRQELERVLASSGFARNERLSQFLRYVVHRPENKNAIVLLLKK